MEPVLIPRDCRDGFTGAFWARPEAYLDPGVRAGMSSFASITPEETEAFRGEADQLLGRYFELEDPNRVRVVGVELMMEAEVGGVVSRQVLQEVPNFGRNFLAMAGLVPGSTNGPPASRQRDFSGASVTVSGASAEANNFIIDGISDNMEFSL